MVETDIFMSVDSDAVAGETVRPPFDGGGLFDTDYASRGAEPARPEFIDILDVTEAVVLAPGDLVPPVDESLVSPASVEKPPLSRVARIGFIGAAATWAATGILAGAMYVDGLRSGGDAPNPDANSAEVVPDTTDTLPTSTTTTGLPSTTATTVVSVVVGGETTAPPKETGGNGDKKKSAPAQSPAPTAAPTTARPAPKPTAAPPLPSTPPPTAADTTRPPTTEATTSTTEDVGFKPH
jgi:hypothetical protein